MHVIIFFPADSVLGRRDHDNRLAVDDLLLHTEAK